MYFHFTSLDGRLAYDDNRQVVVGETLAVDGDVRIGRWGLHASPSVPQALFYAKGLRLWGVDFPQGISQQEDNKVVGPARRALRDFGDVSALVVEFARDCAARANGYAYAAAAAANAADATANAVAKGYAAAAANGYAYAAAAVAAAAANGYAYAAAAVAAANAADATANAVAKGYAAAAAEAATAVVNAAADAAAAATVAVAKGYAAAAYTAERERQQQWWESRLGIVAA